MAKNNFSSAVKGSLEGRAEQPLIISEKIITEDESVTADKKVSSTEHIPEKKAAKSKRSNAGRKKLEDKNKKKQMVLTLTPDTYNRLIEWADTKSRTAPNYVSEFVEEHIDEIIK